jgi:hypothetical protein
MLTVDALHVDEAALRALVNFPETPSAFGKPAPNDFERRLLLK